MRISGYAYVRFKDSYDHDVVVLVDHIASVVFRSEGSLCIGLASGEQFGIADPKEVKSVGAILMQIFEGKPVGNSEAS